MVEKWFAEILNIQESDPQGRTKLIRLTSFIGIAANLIFAGTKLLVGFGANSVAILSDAVNNLSDAVSSLITLVALKFSQRPPDRKHPLGYGRIEYISGMIISVLVLVAGVEFLQTSIRRILSPESTNFVTVQFVLLGMTIVGKWILSRFTIAVGKKTDSDSLVAAGTEAKMDVFASLLTVAAAFISIFTGWQMDGYVGVALSLFILYAGLGLVRDTVSSIIGERPDKELADKIKAAVIRHEPIVGAYDLILHSYGPTKKIGSINLEIPDHVTVEKAYEAMDMAQQNIYLTYGIYLTFGLYSVNTYDEETIERREVVREMIAEISGTMGLHNFKYNKEQKLFRFDVIVDFSIQDFGVFRELVADKIHQKYPDDMVQVNIDLDYS